MVSFTATMQAAERMKPGLWLITVKSDAMAQMPQLSPQQMEMLRQRGITPGGGMESRICITKEMAERDRPPMGKSQKKLSCAKF